MANVLAVVVAFGIALGLLGMAVAAWLFLDRLRTRLAARRRSRPPDRT